MVFGVQKPPFCNAKRGFLRIVKYPAYTAQTIYRVQNVYQRTHRNIHFFAQIYRNVHSTRRRGRFIAPVFQSKPNGFNVAK